MSLFPWLLWLHIFGAIIAFGPTFAFPLIGSMGGKEPMHANFAMRITEKIERGITIPLAIVQGITGLGLLLVSGRNLERLDELLAGDRDRPLRHRPRLRDLRPDKAHRNGGPHDLDPPRRPPQGRLQPVLRPRCSPRSRPSSRAG